MRNNVLFIQEGGEGGYQADKKMVVSLQQALGKEYEISYPEIKSDESEPDFGWISQITKQFIEVKTDVIVVAHFFGSSMVLKYLSENEIKKNIKGLFLIATPFWSGKEKWKQGLKLQQNFADKLPDNTPIFLYHCLDDEEIPFSQMALYQQKLTLATSGK